MQEETIRFFNRIATPWLDAIAEGITILGEQYLFIAVITLVYWNISKKTGLLLAFSYLSAAIVNIAVKILVQAPRPFELLADIEGKRVHTATGYSFPSGHTQGAAGFLTAAALVLRTLWFTCCAGLIMVLIALSRVYLGVHWPIDVLAGLILGIVTAWGTFRILDPLLESSRRLEAAFLAGSALIAAATLVLAVLESTGALEAGKIVDFYKIAGTAVGAMTGSILEMRLVKFSTAAGKAVKTLRFGLGIGGTIILLVGLKGVLPGGNGFVFLRYLLTALWLIFLYPWIGVRCGLFRIRD